MSDASRLLYIAIDRAIDAWGGPAWQRIGIYVRRAAIAEQLLVVIASQDDSMTGEKFRELFETLYAEFNNLFGDM